MRHNAGPGQIEAGSSTARTYPAADPVRHNLAVRPDGLTIGSEIIVVRMIFLEDDDHVLDRDGLCGDGVEGKTGTPEGAREGSRPGWRERHGGETTPEGKSKTTTAIPQGGQSRQRVPRARPGDEGAHFSAVVRSDSGMVPGRDQWVRADNHCVEVSVESRHPRLDEKGHVEPFCRARPDSFSLPGGEWDGVSAPWGRLRFNTPKLGSLHAVHRSEQRRAVSRIIAAGLQAILAMEGATLRDREELTLPTEGKAR